jgi:membrane protease YdiL (CAAX protease family)
MPEWGGTAGRGLFGAALLISWFAAFFQTSTALGRLDASAARTGSDLRKSGLVAALLALLQLLYLAAAYLVPGWRQIAGIGWFYLFCAVPVPFLWSAGRIKQQALDWPRWKARFTRRQKWTAVAALALVGLGFSLVLFSRTKIEAGPAVTDISDRANTTSALLLMVVWLVINAPWIEELSFRHYMLPALTRWWGGGRIATIAALVVSSMLFAVGHAAHMEPAWPKLLQVFTWGLTLGCVRIWLGTGYCIALHLAWNLTAPVLAALL